jgi:hypothetical protein
MSHRVLARFTAGAGLKACVAAALVLASAAAVSFAPAAAHGAASSPGRINWFYKPPTDGTHSSQVAARHAEVVLTGRGDLGFRDKLRQAGFSGRIWNYVEQPFASAPVDNPCGTFGVWWDLWDNQVAWEHQAGVAGSNDFCRYIHRNESWMLHRPGDGSRLTRRSGNQTQYYMNPGSTGWREWFASRVARDLTGWRYDGLFLDDLWSNNGRHGGFREYPSTGAYEQAVIGFIQHLKSRNPGLRVIGNTENPEVYSPALDGWMYEAFGGWWSNRYQSEQDVVRLWQLAERDSAAGKDIFLISQGERSDQRKLRFSYAAYLMVAHDRVSFRYSNVSSYQQYWDYPEYRVALGRPVGTRRNVGGSVWRRDFEGGTALVNLSASTAQRIRLDNTYRTADGIAVTSVMLVPQTGLLLLRATGLRTAAAPRATGAQAQQRPLRSFTPVARRLRARGVDVERYLRRRPAVRRAYRITGTRWSGQRFYTRPALARWLDARGRSYRTWARRNPAQAQRLVVY